MLTRWIQLLKAAARLFDARRRRAFGPTERPRNNAAELGSWAESLVIAQLRDHRLELLDRNVRLADGEIDIIAEGPEGLIFIEVKARRWRTGTERPQPAEAVDERKSQRIQRAARAWLQKSQRFAESIRFDVVAVLLIEASESVSRDFDIDWIENAFDADPKIFLF